MQLQFRNVSFFKKEEFGIRKLSFNVNRRSRILFETGSDDQSEALIRLLEGKTSPENGVIDKSEKLFIQSDRWWFGGRILDQNVQRWFAMCDPFFMFGNRKRTKEAFIDKLDARYIRHFPVYKLKDEARFKFACLSMMFQETGMIVLSKLLTDDFFTANQKWVKELIEDSHASICCVINKNTLKPDKIEFIKQFSWKEIPINKEPNEKIQDPASTSCDKTV